MLRTSINMKAAQAVVKNGKGLKLSKFFEVINPPYVTIRIRPHTSSRNQSTKDFGIMMSELYRKPLSRYHRDRWKITYTAQECLTFEIEFINGGIHFLISCPQSIAPTIMQKCKALWKDSHIDIDDGYVEQWDVSKTVVYELLYAKNDVLSINTDASNNMPLESMFYAIRNMGENDHAKMYCHIEPRHRGKWMLHYSDVMEKLKQGTILPHKSYTASFLEVVGFWMAKVFGGILLSISDIITDNAENVYKKQLDEANAARFSLEQLTNSTKEKASSPILRTHIWVLSESDNLVSAQNTAQIIAGSFRDLSDNNELIAVEMRGKRKVQAIQLTSTKGIPKDKRFNLMSHKEVGKIFQVPGLELQEQFPEVVGVKSREVDLPSELFDDSGIPIGVVVVKGKPKMAYLPTNDKDILCRPHIVFGGQGCGKTLGFGANTALSMIKKGYSVFYLDMADGNAIDAIRDQLPLDYPDRKCIDLDFGNDTLPIACEIADVTSRSCAIDEKNADLEAIKTADRITSFFMRFIDKLTEDMGDPFSQRMTNIAKAAGRATLIDPANGLMDMIAVLRDENYRHHVMEKIRDTQASVYRTLASLDKQNRDNSIDGIIDRIAVLSGDITLSNLFLQPPKTDEYGKPLLDYRKFMDNDEGGYGYFVGIRVPTTLEDIIPKVAFFQFAKIWLACRTRIDLPKEKRRPFAFIIDEPHVFARDGMDLFMQASVEARKYRCKLVWLMHSPDQFNSGRGFGNNSVMEKIISGGVNITAYKTEKVSDYRTFATQLAPFDDKEVYETLPPRGKAINKIAISLQDNMSPFIAQMLPEPGKQADGTVKKVKDRSYRRIECSRLYGRPWREVVDMIEKRTSELNIGVGEQSSCNMLTSRGRRKGMF